GRVIKYLGDGALLTFPVHRARDAVSALREIQAAGSASWGEFDPRCRVQVKVGLGTVVGGMLGAPGDERFDIVGDALNRLFKAPWGETAGDFVVAPEVAELLG